MPPLRERRGDVPLLVRALLARARAPGQVLRFAPDAIGSPASTTGPGNIRELRNLIERLQILHEGDEVGAGDAATPSSCRAAAVRRRPPPGPRLPADGLASLPEVERRHVERVLQATGWNKARAARVLEVDIKTLNKKIRDFGIARTA